MIDLTVNERNIQTAAVLGSTGSVGTQTLDVIRELGLRVDFLAAGRNVRLLTEQIREFRPKTVSVADEAAAAELRELLGNDAPEILCSADEFLDAVRTTESDIIFHSIGGLEGTAAAFAAADSGKRVGMANKEAIIAAGDLIFDRIRASGGDHLLSTPQSDHRRRSPGVAVAPRRPRAGTAPRRGGAGELCSGNCNG